jgi:hypothetical protein
MLFLGLTACATRPEDDFSSSSWRADADRARPPEGNVELNVTGASVQASEFTLGGLRDPWDQASRVEAELWYHIGLPRRLDPMVGAYGFYDVRDWSEGPAEVDYRAAGLGVQLGARFDPGHDPEPRPVRVTMTPYSRLGWGLQTGEFENIPVSNGFSSGDVDRWRLEGTVGADFRLDLMRTLVLGVGTGLSGWFSPKLEGVTRGFGGGVVDTKDQLRFQGWDWFVRITAGIDF